MKRPDIFPTCLNAFLLLLLVLESSSDSLSSRSNLHELWRRRNALLLKDLQGLPLFRKDLWEDEGLLRSEKDRMDDEIEYDDEEDIQAPLRYAKRGNIFFTNPSKSKLYSIPQDFRKGMSSSSMILRGQVPSLSISNNIDVLRNQLRKQVNLRMRNKSRNQVILQNSNLLEDLGRRRRR